MGGGAKLSKRKQAASPPAVPDAHAVAPELSPLERELIESIVRGDHGDPFSFLGRHRAQSGFVVRAFRPDAEALSVAPEGGPPIDMRRVHPAGFFVTEVENEDMGGYRLRALVGGRRQDFADPYAYGSLLGELDLHLIAEGDHRRLYEVLGAHPIEVSGVSGVRFAVWAPNARRVSVVGPFNDWDGRVHPMRKHLQAGIWEIFIPGLTRGAVYKFEILNAHGHLLPLKADPVAFRGELRPANASVVHGVPKFEWSDRAWMETRAARASREAPISIYEAHLASWMQVPEEGGRWLTYRELAETLPIYARDMGFTHIELLPVSEYPFDGSWGYQPTGMFAPTSRFGPPEDFAYFVDACHRAEIGVILDWVPGHFPTDAHGLGLFDGTHLYEHADPRLGFHRDWNTLIYNYGRREVANFLIASALYWLREFHIDGLRVDAVASMLYLDYSRPAGEWTPNRHGGRENLEAIDFLRRLNTLCYAEAPGATMIAEESTAWPGVCQPAHLGGLGFGYKWNMGWMNDSLRYISRDPIHRRHHHSDLTFGLVYAFSENFILPISHDEVVHGKGSLLGRMPGDQWRRFANLRAYLAFMFAHPGKTLLFQGCEFAQEREWKFDESLDWHLLQRPEHRGVQTLVRDLNHLVRETPALYRYDSEPRGFEWLVEHDAEDSVYAFLRKGEAGDPPVIVALNFTPLPRHNYRIGAPRPGWYAEKLNTDAAYYGGSGIGNVGGVEARPGAWGGQPCTLELTLPPLAGLILQAPGDA
jgi:1,4-alpha-glucan branching enzyme